MNGNGVSKKLCITAAGVAAVFQMSSGVDDADKWKFALIIGGMCVIYKVVQGFIDWKK